MHNTTDEKRWPDPWLTDGDAPAAGAFPSRFEYAFALTNQIQAAVPPDGSPAWRVAFHATSALRSQAVADDDGGTYALRQLQGIARETL